MKEKNLKPLEEKKFGLINSFEEDLDETYLENISKNVDNYSYEELEVILSKEFTNCKTKQYKK